MIDLDDLLDSGPSSGTINFSGLDTGDTITVADGGRLSETHETALQNVLDKAMEHGDMVTLSTDGSKLSVAVDWASDEDKLANETAEYNFLAG